MGDSPTLQDVLSNGKPKPRKSIPESAVARKRGRPGPQKRVDDEVIIDFLRQGYSQADIARAVHLSDQAISKRVRTLGHRAVAAMFHADSQLWGIELKTMMQLAELNARLLNIARGKKAKSEEVVSAAREIRQQLDFQMRFQDALKVQQRFEEFRETVLRVLDEVGQELGVDLREKVMNDFKRRTESRLMLTRPRLAEGKGGRAHRKEKDDSALLERVTGPPVEAEVEAEVQNENENENENENDDEVAVIVFVDEEDDDDEEGGVDFDL